jgi:glutamate synthase (NADPH/NADH) large chain
MMRKCHLNTCPVGVATQDPELRKRFTGQPEHVVNYFFFVAEELRKIMSKLGVATVSEMTGQMDRLKMKKAISHWKAKGLDYSKILSKPNVDDSVAVFNCEKQDHGLDDVLDQKMLVQAAPALEQKMDVKIETTISNVNRSFGAMLSGEVARRYGHSGLPANTIQIQANGTAGQSFGAWVANGISITLEGEANDYVGKGLSGGKLIIFPPRNSSIGDRRENIIVGNTVLYGAICGEAYFNGVAGERFCVRNSGANAVVEGLGDHGCEYMTGGVVVCLGETGRNFAAGMSGGIAYVLDEVGDFRKKCNTEMVTLDTVDSDKDGEERQNMLEADEARLKYFITKHLELTGSDIAQSILADWQTWRPRFVKVMPNDYQSALKTMASDQQQEISTLEVQLG